MHRRRRELFAIAVVLAVAVAIEAFALRAGTLGTVIIAALAGIAAIVFLFRGNVALVGLGSAYLCAFTLTWNGWFVGPVRPGDVLILVTLVLLLVANPNRAVLAPPWWVKVLVLAIALVALLTILLPPDPFYLAHRTVLGANGKPTVFFPGPLWKSNLKIAFKFIIAVAAIPAVFAGAALIDRRAPRRLGVAFTIGAALSGWAATLDHLGANFGHIITHIPNIGSRQFGFADHPNFLAAGLVIGLPFAYWLLASYDRREQLIGLACLPGFLGGVYASGSRGGAVCIVAVLGLCVILHRRTRAYAPIILLAGLLAAVFVAALVPSVGSEILRVTRLSGNTVSTQGSDIQRALLATLGVNDFKFSPIKGIGLQASFDASEVYLQELASGGIILFIGMQLYMGGAIFTAFRYIKRNDMAMACLGALIGMLALNFFEADLTDRFYYVPAAILIAMVRNEHLGATTEDGERLDEAPVRNVELARS